MKKLIAIILLSLCSYAYAIGPRYTTSTNSYDTFWLKSTNFYEVYDGISERYLGSDFNGYTYTPYLTPVGPYPFNPLVPTNEFWIWNFTYRNSSVGSAAYQYPEAPEQLYEVITKYAMVTNINDSNFYNQADMSILSNWTHKAMYDYLATSFTNSDGTVGVGKWLDGWPDSTQSNWVWTLSWETNRKEIVLGELVYEITNSAVESDGIYHVRAGWKYHDGDRIVRKPMLGQGFIGPPEWSITTYNKSTNDPNSQWWTSAIKNYYDNSFTWHMFGRMYDYTDIVTNYITFRIGSKTNAWTNLASNITLDIKGHTNYASVWNTDGWYRQVRGWNNLTTNIGGNASNDILYLNTELFDLGGYSNEVLKGVSSSYATNWIDGLVCTNSEDWTNGIPATNHLGDAIVLKMNHGRLYYWPQDPSRGSWRTLPALNPFYNNEQLNELYVVCSLLRMKKYLYNRSAQDPTQPSSVSFLEAGWNATPKLLLQSSGITYPYAPNPNEHSTDTWANAKSTAAASWPKSNSVASALIYPSIGHMSAGFTNVAGYEAQLVASRSKFYYKWSSTRTYTNISSRCDWYFVPTNNTECMATYNHSSTPNWYTNAFDDNSDTDALGNTIQYMRLAKISTTNIPAGLGANFYSDWFGADTNVIPNWCDNPVNGYATKGWQHHTIIMLRKWDFLYCTNNL